MAESEQIATRYLLGELSESEQSTLEEKYFSDPRVFDQVLQAESKLVDNYARGRLSVQARERFERYYLINPRRRARAQFAEALAARLDQIEDSEAAAEQPVGLVSWWQKLIEGGPSQRMVWGFSMALASLLIAVGGVWFFIENRRLRQELAQTQAAQGDQARRERELQQQLTDERIRANELSAKEARADELAAELERARAQQQTAQTTRATPSAPAFVTLLLTVGGVRGADTGPHNTLIIPPGTQQVRLQLNLKEHDYPDYSVILRAVGGAEVFGRQGLRPRTTKPGASFVLTVPAGKFLTGDYVLTIRGVRPDGEVDDVSKSLFHVERK